MTAVEAWVGAFAASDHLFTTCPAFGRIKPWGDEWPRRTAGPVDPHGGDICGWCVRVWDSQNREEPARICGIEGCGGEHEARGYCWKHYWRLITHGNPMHTKPTWRETFWRHVEVTGFCWIWIGRLSEQGYGLYHPGRNEAGQAITGQAHRVAYELLVGDIPDGLQLDHLCRIPACVNPDHLEPVTARENVLRSFSPTAINARKTHCKWDHEFTPENTYRPPNQPTKRKCRTCARIKALAAYHRRRAAQLGAAA